MQLHQMIQRAVRREENDDHLTDEERMTIVTAFREANPNVELPEDMTDAFIEIIF